MRSQKFLMPSEHMGERSKELRFMSGPSRYVVKKGIRRLLSLALMLAADLCCAPGDAFASPQCVPECFFRAFGIRSGAPEPASPLQHVRMDSQEVMIRLKKRTYRVDAAFRFFNTGPTITEWVGFPKRGNACRGSRQLDPAFIRFDCLIDGQRLDLSETRDYFRDAKNVLYTLYYSGSRAAPCDETCYRWLGACVTFPAQSRTTLRICYEANYLYGGEFPPISKAFYIVGTASNWKRCIGVFALTVDGSGLGKEQGFDVRNPGTIRITRDVERRVIRNFNPSPGEEVEVAIAR